MNTQNERANKTLDAANVRQAVLSNTQRSEPAINTLRTSVKYQSELCHGTVKRRNEIKHSREWTGGACMQSYQFNNQLFFVWLQMGSVRVSRDSPTRATYSRVQLEL